MRFDTLASDHSSYDIKALADGMERLCFGLPFNGVSEAA